MGNSGDDDGDENGLFIIKSSMKYQVSFRAKTWYLPNVNIACYLHMWKYHHCYGFIINHTFQTKKLFK